MKKAYWKISLLLMFTVLFSIYVSRLYEVKRMLPTEGWSHFLQIEEDVDEYMKRRIGLLHTQDAFLTYFVKEDHFKVVKSDASNQVTKLIDIPNFGQSILKVTAKWEQVGKSIQVLYLDEKGIFLKSMDLDGKLISEMQLYDGAFGNVKSLQLLDQLILIQFVEEYQMLSYEGELVHKEVISYKTKILATEDEFRLYMHKSDLEEAEILVYDKTGNLLDAIDASESKDRENLGFAQTMQVFDHQLAVVFSKFKSSEKKTTKFSSLIWDKETGEFLRRDSATLGYTDEPVQIKSIDENGTQLIVTGSTKFGSNVLEILMKNASLIESKPLTKTLSAVTNPLYFTLKGEEYLLWFDVKDDLSDIYLASTKQELIEESYSNLDLSLLTMVGNGLMGILGSFLMVIHAVAVIFLPCFLLMFLLMKAQKKLAFKEAIASSIAMFVHLGIKLYYVLVLMQPSSLSIMFEKFFTNQGLIALVLVLTSIISASISLNFKKQVELDSEHYVYAFYALVDLTALMLTYQVYVYSMQMITRL